MRIKEESKYKLVNVVRYLGDALLYPFLPLYFSYLNKTESEIGMLMMIIPLLGALLNPLWSIFSKNVNYNRTYLKILAIFEALVIIYLLIFIDMPFLILGTVVLGIVGQPFYSLFDGYTTVYTMMENKNYAPIRLYGSLSFALAALIAGFLLDKTSFTFLFGAAALMYLFVSIAVSWVKPLDLSHLSNISSKANPKELLKNKHYLKFTAFFIISMGLLFGGDSFLGIFFEYLNHSPDIYGLVVFVQVILEAIILFLLAKWKYKNKMRIIMISIVLSNFARYVIFSFYPPLYLLVFAATLRAIAMGSILYVSVEYLKLKVSSKNITLGIIIYNSLKNIFQAGYTLWGGYFIENVSYQKFYIISAFVSLIALIFIDYKQTHDIIKKDVIM